MNGRNPFRSSSLVDLLDRPQRGDAVRARAIGASVVAIAVIGLVDHLTASQYSFAFFYLLPVAFAALTVRPVEGHLLALVAAVTWVVAEPRSTPNRDVIAAVWNGAGRFVTMSAIVYLIGALRAVVVRLASSERRSREFLATAAHQLRTPIAGLVASAEALGAETDPATRVRLNENLEAGTNRARRLLSSLLEISRLDQGERVSRRAVDVAELCRREVEAAGILHPRLDIRYAGPDEFVVETGADALREALSNLVDNAVRHAVTSVTVRVAQAPAHSSRVAIEVLDDGPGLPVGSEVRVFDRFVSLDGLGGSGLGLPIARASVRAIGGDVSYEGGCFRITLG